MKKILLFTLIVNTFPVQGQSLISTFPDSNAIWKDYSSSTSYGPSQHDIHIYDALYSLQGDTTLGNHYSKLYHATWHHHFHVTPSTTTHDSAFSCGYKGAIRSDTLQRLYFWSSNDTAEYLLYDFNLSIGDTLPLTWNYYTYFYNTNIVQSIDSILIGSQYHKRLNICTTANSSVFVSLIEGVGSTKGLLGALTWPSGFSCDAYSDLTCFCVDSIPLYTSSTNSCPGFSSQPCNFYFCSPVGIKESIKEESLFNISPNPATNQLRIKNAELRIEKVEIFDVLGQKYNSAFYILNSELTVDVSSLAPGIYFVKVKSKKGESAAKFVKQ